MFIFNLVPPTAKISPEYVVVKKGRSFNLKCQVLGSPAPTIEWKKVGTNELSYQSLLSFDNELVATAARAEDAGTYVCTATNIHGVSRSSAEVTVVGEPFVRIKLNAFCSTNKPVMPFLRLNNYLRKSGAIKNSSCAYLRIQYIYVTLDITCTFLCIFLEVTNCVYVK